jgi:transposase-like protein
MSSTKHAKDHVLEAVKVASGDEAKAVDFLEQQRWGDSPACPHCGSADVYRMTGRDGQRERNFRWRCRVKGGCGKMFSVRTRTVLEESRLPVRVWLHCYWRACASKKGVSALQISRETGASYKSALFLMHRLRHAMADIEANRPKLTGTVEIDETYVGGKPRNKGPWNKRGTSGKIPVIGIVQRGGDLRLSVMDRVTVNNLAPAIAANVDLRSRLCTDESTAYARIGECFEGGHESVAHGKREYARGDVHSNTIEGAFSLLKRGIYGTFHSVSRKHLPKYLAEFEFRYNARKANDGDRLALAIKASDGKRLTYAQQVTG